MEGDKMNISMKSPSTKVIMVYFLTGLLADLDEKKLRDAVREMCMEYLPAKQNPVIPLEVTKAMRRVLDNFQFAVDSLIIAKGHFGQIREENEKAIKDLEKVIFEGLEKKGISIEIPPIS